MTYKDILKKSFLEGFNSNLDTSNIVSVLAVAFVVSLFIFCIYRVTTRKAFYSKSFNISLVGLTLITAGIILTIQSNAVLSLGMVGALSIVRFRTAIKEPMDLVFLFWSISVGIICGAGMFELAILLSIGIACVIILLELIPVTKAPMILVINADSIDAEEQIVEIVKANTAYMKIKSRNITKVNMDMVIELRTKTDRELVTALHGVEHVQAVSLLSHDGEVTY